MANSRDYGKNQRRNFDDGGAIDPNLMQAGMQSAPIGKKGRRSAAQADPSASSSSLVPPGMRAGANTKMAEKYPGWPTMSVDAAWENHPAKKSSYERTNPSW